MRLKITGGELIVEFEEGSLIAEARRQLDKASKEEDAETKKGIREAGVTRDGNKFMPQLGDKSKVKI